MDVGTRIYSENHDRFITYVGRAYNGEDYEFTDDEDNLIILDQNKFDELSAKADGKIKTVILVYKIYDNMEYDPGLHVREETFLGVAKDFDIVNKLIDKERKTLKGWKPVKNLKYTYEDTFDRRLWFYYKEEIVIEEV